jgi:hypothetical protein
MARILDMRKKWMEELAYRKTYETLEKEFALAAAVIRARKPHTRLHNSLRENRR